MSETDAAEAKRRAEWLHKHKAHKDWVILSVSEIAVIRAELEATERERDEAREENKKLKEALLRVRTWGISSKNFDASDSYQMAEWIDNGCAGELPKPDGPWIYERLEAAK
jgi:hypothetical protein